MIKLAPLLVGTVLAAAGAAMLHAAVPFDGNDPQGELTGGATTVHADGRNAFSFPAANLDDDERTRFVIGNSFFRRNWVQAPASTTARDGLGPHFIARSCGGCHVQDGRAAPPAFRKGLSDEQPVGLLLRLSVPGKGDFGAPKPEPTYGDQFANLAVQGVKPEGQIVMHWKAIHGRFADGSTYTLQKPLYGFRKLAYGPMAKDVMVSPRIAPQLIGVGLLEAIPEQEILHNAATQAASLGAIKGVPNRVYDAFAEREMIGRFGWKANAATLAHQTASAFLGDIGITSTRFWREACTEKQKDCLAARSGSHPDTKGEIDDETLANVIFYQANLAPPARRLKDEGRIEQGRQLFMQAQCAVCHRPSYTTAEGPFPNLTSKALQGQKIWPYTDLLLHDMGDDLADGRPDFSASGKQWRTSPLWGIGLLKDVNGHTRLLHDGRADGVLEAILWHGGEAEASKQQVLKMNQAERSALVKFVESL
ncbi:thiol oxidoreductase [Noviherbaspirillum sp. Root189]|nr:thiol oxidoreductase [Noviherbaspirillum sp. Root189]